MREIIEIYKGIQIIRETDPIPTYSTIEKNIPVIGEMETGHNSIEEAKKYIDKIKENPNGK